MKMILFKDSYLHHVCFREAADEDVPMVDEDVGQVAPVAAGLAAVERLQRAARQDEPPASQGLPSPPKRPFKSPGVSSLCALATNATLRLMTGTFPPPFTRASSTR